MPLLTETSRIIADELRRAEHSINIAARDAAQFLVTTLEAGATHGLSAAMMHSTVKATVGALAALAESQSQMAMRAHHAVERVGRDLGLDETSWGEGLPKPSAHVSQSQGLVAA